MRVSLNLASRPYVELRPLYKRLRLVIAVLALFAVGFWLVLRTEYVRARDAQARVDAIQAQVDRMRAEERRDEAAMQQPREAMVLKQAQFLNQMFLHKAFSWTAVMMDLERVLPAGVQVTNIDPQVAKDGHVTVRLRVQGQHERAVDLMRNLEKSKRFLTPRLTSESSENSGNQNGNPNFQNAGLPTGVNFEIVADYNPLPPRVKEAESAPVSKGMDARTPDASDKAERKNKRPPRIAMPATPPGGAR